MMDVVFAPVVVAEDAAARSGSRVVVVVVGSGAVDEVGGVVAPSVVVGNAAGVKRSFSCSAIGFVDTIVAVLDDEGSVRGDVVVVVVVAVVELTAYTVAP